MRRTLSPEQVAEKCETARETQKMPFARALRDCIWGLSGAVVDRLGRTAYSLRTVDSWFNFNDPQRGPAQVLAACMEVARENGRPDAEALAPLEQLNHHFGRYSRPSAIALGGESLHEAFAVVAKETGEVEAMALRSLGDGELDIFEARRLQKEVHQASEALLRIEAALEERIKGGRA